MKYQFTQEEYQACVDFSEGVDTSFYASRGQSNVDKRKKDSLVGKLGEVAVFNILKSKYEDLTYPDFKIYKPREKSWDFDLKAANLNLHVKTQNVEQGRLYGESWIFQHGGEKRGHYDKEIFDKTSPNQYVAFVTVDLPNKTAYIKSILHLDKLHENNLFKPPKLEYLKLANKLAVYFNDINSCVNPVVQL